MTGVDVETVHALRRDGWDVVALHSVDADGRCSCGRPTCPPKHRGKHPVSKAWTSTPALSGPDVEETWTASPHPLNVGARTGSGLLVVDLDGEDGARWRQENAERLPATREHRTGSGGTHLLYRLPAGVALRNTAKVLGPGVDTRADGGMVVLPPSVSGLGAYSVQEDREQVQAPAWLVEALRRTEAPQTPAPAQVHRVDLPPAEQARADRYFESARAGELERLDECVRLATPGGSGYTGPPWDATTFQVAANLTELANAPWTAYSHDDVESDVLRHAPKDGGFTFRTVASKLASARAKVGSTARPLPADRADLSAAALDDARTPAVEAGAHRETAPATDEVPTTDVVDLDRLFPVLDWHSVFSAEQVAVQWLCEPLLERGRAVAVYSPPKAGKSLLVLEIAAALAAGHPVLGNPAADPVTVLYVDVENTVDDVRERLTDMGYGPADLERLRYLSFPSLAALDTPAGGTQLMQVVDRHEPALVVVDTLSRVVEGEENRADTVNGMYRHVVAPLKGRGIAYLRLDHAGKDLDKGPRGSSSKGGDVDAVWRLTDHGSGRIGLSRDMSRQPRPVDRLQLQRHAEPLRHLPTETPSVVDPRVARLVAALDEAGLPLTAGRDRARDVLIEADLQASTELIAKAVRARKSRSGTDLTGQDRSSLTGAVL